MNGGMEDNESGDEDYDSDSTISDFYEGLKAKFSFNLIKSIFTDETQGMEL
jgi:hypothetical protein